MDEDPLIARAEAAIAEAERLVEQARTTREDVAISRLLLQAIVLQSRQERGMPLRDDALSLTQDG